MEKETKNKDVTANDGKPMLDEFVSLGKDKLLDLLLLKVPGYLTPWDYNSTERELAEKFITRCNSEGVNPFDFI